jgi:hypothetical protein
MRGPSHHTLHKRSWSEKKSTHIPKVGTRFTLPRTEQMIPLGPEDVWWQEWRKQTSHKPASYLVSPGPACVWRRRPELGRNNVALLSDHFNSRCRRVADATFVRSTYRYVQNWQRSSHTRTVGQCCAQAAILHVTACYCCFESNSAQSWNEDQLNCGQAAIRIHRKRTAGEAIAAFNTRLDRISLCTYLNRRQHEWMLLLTALLKHWSLNDKTVILLPAHSFSAVIIISFHSAVGTETGYGVGRPRH